VLRRDVAASPGADPPEPVDLPKPVDLPESGEDGLAIGAA